MSTATLENSTATTEPPAVGVPPLATGSTVFRVQDKDGRGTWKPGFSHLWSEDRSDEEYAALVPWPLQFGMIHRKALAGWSVGCGCTSLEQLRRWFTLAEYRKLRKHGYRAVKLHAVRILAASDIQCVFERAKPLGRDVEPVELYPQNTEASDAKRSL